MAFLKINSDGISTFCTNADNISQDITYSISGITRFLDSIIIPSENDEKIFKEETRTRTEYMGPNPYPSNSALGSGWQEYQNVTETVTVRDYREQLGKFKAAIAEIKRLLKQIQDVQNKFLLVKGSLQAIKNFVNWFETDSAYTLNNVLESMGYKGGVKEEDGFNFSIDEDGVVYYVYTDEEGNEIQITLAEMVNAFYTETGITMSSMILAADVDGTLDLRKQEDIYGSVSSFVTGLGPTGVFGVSSEEDIKTVMNGLGVPIVGADALWNEYSSDLPDIVNTRVANNDIRVDERLLSAFTLTAGLGLFGKNVLDDKDDPNNIDPEPNKPNKDVSNSPKPDSEEPSNKKPNNPQNNNPVNDPSDDRTPSNSLKDPDNTEPGDKENETPSTETPTDDKEPAIDIVEVTETPLPDEIEEPALTAEEVDALAKDEFYEQFEDNGEFLEKRAEDLSKFEELYTNNQEELIQELKDMGYNDAEIESLMVDKDMASTAYLLGKQNQETAQIANNLAQENNIDNFDTVYDDKPNVGDLTDGSAEIELTNLFENEQVKEAKVAFDEAQTDYVESVNKANESIEAANNYEEVLHQTLAEIHSKSGTDTCDWTPEQIERINKATTDYNNAVEKAYTDYEAAKQSKVVFDEAKVKYQESKDAFYENLENMKNDELNESTNIQEGNNDSQIIQEEKFEDESFLDVL